MPSKTPSKSAEQDDQKQSEKGNLKTGTALRPNAPVFVPSQHNIRNLQADTSTSPHQQQLMFNGNIEGGLIQNAPPPIGLQQNFPYHEQSDPTIKNLSNYGVADSETVATQNMNQVATFGDANAPFGYNGMPHSQTIEFPFSLCF